MKLQPVPIFILGQQRSGTTFAANLLAAHPQIAAVAAAHHRGVHESVFFSHFGRMFGSWSDPVSRARAIEAFMDSDYFALTGLSRDDPALVPDASPTPAAFFRKVMDKVAAREGAQAWVEKSPHHTLMADDIWQDMPDARFICVVRDYQSFLASRLWSYGRVPPRYPRRALLILRACASNTFHARALGALKRRLPSGSVFVVTFARLRDNPRDVLDPILASMALNAIGDARSSYAPNSSFAGARDRDRALTLTDRCIARLAVAAVRSVPQPVLRAVQRVIAARRPQEFPVWVWPDRGAETCPPEPR